MPIGIRTSTGTSTICGISGSGIGWLFGSVPQPVNAAADNAAQRSDLLGMRLCFIIELLDVLLEPGTCLPVIRRRPRRRPIHKVERGSQPGDRGALLGQQAFDLRDRAIALVAGVMPARGVVAGEVERCRRRLCQCLGCGAVVPLPTPESEERGHDQAERGPPEPTATDSD